MIFHTEEIKKTVPNNVTIVAATKYFTPKEMEELYHTGIKDFGENRVESFIEKYALLSHLDVTWHFIGTLQTKKVKKIVNQIDVLHSLNTIKLADELNKRRDKVLPCFLQVNISNEENKHGFEVSEVNQALQELSLLEKIKIVGFMGMAEYTTNEETLHKEFQKLNDLQKSVKDTLHIDIPYLSIGMSNDYLIALQHNATHIRLGSVLYSKEVE
jgi:pyridoxal phosphate enzyme (YggS family)